MVCPWSHRRSVAEGGIQLRSSEPQATAISKGLYYLPLQNPQGTSLEPIQWLHFRPSISPSNWQGLLSALASLFSNPSKDPTLRKDSNLWVPDSYKWCVPPLCQAARLVTDELVSCRAEPMYLANDKTAMAIESVWIVRKANTGFTLNAYDG